MTPFLKLGEKSDKKCNGLEVDFFGQKNEKLIFLTFFKKLFGGV